MNIFIKMVIFGIMLNFASGIMIASIPALEDDPTLVGGIFYDRDYTKELNKSLDFDVDPSAPLEDTDDANTRLLDLTVIGQIDKFTKGIKQYVYGFPYMLDNVFGDYLEPCITEDPCVKADPTVRTILFGPLGVFNLIISFGWILLIIYLWTGRKVTE